ncbi:MAG: acyltransferase family protein, partial [Hyphomicrobiaceae bacterium]|nr:acyltransferase family protein [Hyphomicrobiaceae bacterium]
AGLFLARSIERDWRTYLDRKVLHFAYFYVLWMVIQCTIKCSITAEHWYDVPLHMVISLVEPFGTLWFVYILPIFFITTKLLRRVAPVAILAVAALLEILPIHTGWTVIDEFAARYVYFFAGYAFAPLAFRVAEEVRQHPLPALGLLAVWGALNTVAVTTEVHVLGWTGSASVLPVVSLILGGLGAFAVISLSALLTDSPFGKLFRYMGERSIVVYLAFFLPMALLRTVLHKIAPDMDVALVSIAVTLFAISVPLLMDVTIRRTGGLGSFLFRRPNWARLVPEKPARPTGHLVPAE